MNSSWPCQKYFFRSCVARKKVTAIGLACQNLGRKFVGWEMNEAYFKVATERLEKKMKFELTDYYIITIKNEY